MGREFELKFRATAAQFSALKEDFPNLQPIAMETTYFDTPYRKLAPLRWTLRRRMENEKSVCTLKIPGENGGRGEWEVESGSMMAAIPMLCKLGAPIDLMVHTVSGIIPICGAKFTRLAGLLEAENCTVELALDEGVLTAGTREQALLEVEVECKSGSEEAAAAFAAQLAVKYGLESEPDSKFARALKLAAQP